MEEIQSKIVAYSQKINDHMSQRKVLDPYSQLRTKEYVSADAKKNDKVVDLLIDVTKSLLEHPLKVLLLTGQARSGK